MASITASVGIANGKQCYNVSGDQKVVQDLLSKISTSQGGCQGKTNWAAPAWGKCAADLADAILKFQQANRAYLPYAPDGHVDPSDATIRLMNKLALYGVSAIPNFNYVPRLELAKPDHDYDPPDIGPLVARGLRETSWALKGSSSKGYSAWIFSTGWGTFNLERDKVPLTYSLDYAMVGAGEGVAPFNISLGPAFMPQKGSHIWTYGSRDLNFQDLLGPLIVVTGQVGGGPVGGTVSIVWFNCPVGPTTPLRLAAALASEAGAELPGLLGWMNQSCGGLAILGGAQFSTFDLSCGINTGFANKG